MAQVHKSTPVAPSSPLRWHPYLGSEIHGPNKQVDFGRTFKPTPVAQVDAKGRTQATPMAQADFGRNLKPAPAAKLLIFSDFSFALVFRKVLFVFCILSPPHVVKNRLL
jgi:hypothetical protein